MAAQLYDHRSWVQAGLANQVHSSTLRYVQLSVGWQAPKRPLTDNQTHIKNISYTFELEITTTLTIFYGSL